MELDAQLFHDVLVTFPMPHVGRYAEFFVEALNDVQHERKLLSDTGYSLGDYIISMLEYAFPELGSAFNGEGGRRFSNASKLSDVDVDNGSEKSSGFDSEAEAQASPPGTGSMPNEAMRNSLGRANTFRLDASGAKVLQIPHTQTLDSEHFMHSTSSNGIAQTSRARPAVPPPPKLEAVLRRQNVTNCHGFAQAVESRPWYRLTPALQRLRHCCASCSGAGPFWRLSEQAGDPDLVTAFEAPPSPNRSSAERKTGSGSH